MSGWQRKERIRSMCDFNTMEYIEKIKAMVDASPIVPYVPEQPRWISVKERLPGKNVWVLAYCKYKGHVIDYVDINGLWSYGNVTHWAVLPEPPKEET